MLYRYGTDGKGKLVKKAVVYTQTEHLISNINIDPDALQIISRLRDAGYTAYIVGGAVRDLIVGNKPKDFDIVTDATPSKIKKIFRNSRIIGRRFRLVHVVFGKKIFEVSTFRSNAEGSVGNDFGTIEEDVLRRDFTLNALYYDPLQEQVIDYVGGMKDIKKHVLKPVIDLDRIFVEDPVRMLRAIKYSATTHAKMSRSLRHKIISSASLLSQISPSRLTEELLKIINNTYAYEIISEALETDLFMYLQPSATGLIYENKKYEKDYMQSIKELSLLNKTNPEVRLGKKMIFLIRDFVYQLTDWEKEIEAKTPFSELYGKTWAECRNFVLPMNPVRRELEFAVKQTLIDLGVSSTIRQISKNTKQKKSENKTKTNSKNNLETLKEEIPAINQ
ncbi:MAG: polynucleotide adenylyltransferase PcnB [Treponema sp.]|nr:polynucleotide adenylyltransferase PcnB [Treponema sp.]MCI7565384.1 polynucleotide adenylyltransferase PcnB [Treponema sp.]